MKTRLEQAAASLVMSITLLAAGACPALAISKDSQGGGFAISLGAQLADVTQRLATQAAASKVGASGMYAKVYDPVSGASKSQLKSWGYWYKPNYVVRIESYKNNRLKFTIGYTGANASPVYTSNSISCAVKNRKGSFRYSDSWSNKGKGVIKLGKGVVKVKVAQTASARMNRGTLATGDKYITLNSVSKKAYDKAIML